MGKKKRPQNLREALKGKLSKKEMEHLITSFDSLGDIAVIQVSKELEKKAGLIGEELLKLNKHFKTVCMVSGKHSGLFRAQPVKVVAGKRNKKALYKENRCSFLVHLGRVFFSPRLCTERQRISELIKGNEVIGAFFAGVGPFPIVFARLTGMKKAYAVELNPEAYKGLLHNIGLNKCQAKVEAILGDVKKVVPKRLLGKCDRVVMPLPKGGENFLKEAMLALKPRGGIVHFYRFVEREKGSEQPLKEIKEAAKELGFETRILRKKKVRSFSASKEQLVIDFWAKRKKGIKIGFKKLVFAWQKG
jgi:tRNA (guanine37-N1)-methyltransferase